MDPPTNHSTAPAATTCPLQQQQGPDASKPLPVPFSSQHGAGRKEAGSGSGVCTLVLSAPSLPSQPNATYIRGTTLAWALSGSPGAAFVAHHGAPGVAARHLAPLVYLHSCIVMHHWWAGTCRRSRHRAAPAAAAIPPPQELHCTCWEHMQPRVAWLTCCMMPAFQSPAAVAHWSSGACADGCRRPHPPGLADGIKHATGSHKGSDSTLQLLLCDRSVLLCSRNSIQPPPAAPHDQHTNDTPLHLAPMYHPTNPPRCTCHRMSGKLGMCPDTQSRSPSCPLSPRPPLPP